MHRLYHVGGNLLSGLRKAPKCAGRIDAVFGRGRGLASGLTKAQTVEGEDNQKDYYDKSSHYDVIFRSDNIRLGYFPHLAPASAGARALDIRESGYALTEHMLDLMKCTSNSRVLDMGCGKGQACVDVARKCGAEVTGLDLSTSNIKRARELQKENPDLKLNFLEGSITALPTELKVRPFTHIMSVQAWVHVHSALDTVLAEARSVLEPGGIVVVEDFCSNDAGVISDQALRHFYKRLHFDSVMSPATWRSKAEAAGFQVEHWEDLRDHMAESYRLMAASAKEHGLRSADGTCLDENYLNTMDIVQKGEATMILAVLKRSL